MLTRTTLTRVDVPHACRRHAGLSSAATLLCKDMHPQHGQELSEKANLGLDAHARLFEESLRCEQEGLEEGCPEDPSGQNRRQ